MPGGTRSCPTQSRTWSTGWKLNTRYASLWPNITIKKDPLPEVEEFDGVENKFENYFSKAPGEGD